MQPSDDWKEAIKKWYKSNGLSEPRDHDTPSVPDYSNAILHDALERECRWLGTLQWLSVAGHAQLKPTAKKPRLTAADICFLRDMKVGL
jgi:hypothetical protein